MVKNQKCPKSPVTSAADYIFCFLGQDKILYPFIFNEVTFTKSEVNFSTLERAKFTVQADFRSLVLRDRYMFIWIDGLELVNFQFETRIKYEDSSMLDWVHFRHIHQIKNRPFYFKNDLFEDLESADILDEILTSFKMNLDYSSTGGGDPKVVPAVKNVSAANLGMKVDVETEICHTTASLVKSSKTTQSAVKNHKMVKSSKRPKWSREPIERFSDISIKGPLYENRLDLSNMICSISYASTADIRILVAQLFCWWSHIKCSRSHHPRLIIMLLLLFAAEKTFCTHFPYRSPLLCHPLVKDFPLVKLWTSETGGVVICLASTLMVLDHFCGKFPTPTRWWY